MKRVYTQPEAELIVLDVNDLQVMMLKYSEQKGALTNDSFAGIGGFGWDKENGTAASSFSMPKMK